MTKLNNSTLVDEMITTFKKGLNMLREHCRIGMNVTFGRRHGEKTVGEVVKMNDKKAKVKILEKRGQRAESGPGAIWGVPYSMMEPIGISVPTKKPLKYDPLMPAEDVAVLDAILACYSGLEPETLTADGERSTTEIARLRGRYETKLKTLQLAFGQPVSSAEIFAWDNERARQQAAGNRQAS